MVPVPKGVQSEQSTEKTPAQPQEKMLCWVKRGSCFPPANYKSSCTVHQHRSQYLSVFIPLLTAIIHASVFSFSKLQYLHVGVEEGCRFSFQEALPVQHHIRTRTENESSSKMYFPLYRCGNTN